MLDKKIKSLIVRRFVVDDYELATPFSRETYYPDFWESREAYNRKLEQFPEGCLICLTDENEFAGYIFSHPWWSDRIVSLDDVKLEIPLKGGDCYYVHDLLINSKLRRRGIGSFLFKEICPALPRKFFLNDVFLVSVLNSKRFWEKEGFSTVEEISYGGKKSHVMKKTICFC